MRHHQVGNLIRPRYPTLWHAHRDHRPEYWLLWRTRRNPNSPHRAWHSKPLTSVLIVSAAVLTVLFVSRSTDGGINSVLWPAIGVIVGWNLMLEHGPFAIGLVAWWGMVIGEVVASVFANNNQQSVSAVCLGTCIGVMILRCVSSRTEISA